MALSGRGGLRRAARLRLELALLALPQRTGEQPFGTASAGQRHARLQQHAGRFGLHLRLPAGLARRDDLFLAGWGDDNGPKNPGPRGGGSEADLPQPRL